MQLSVLGDVPGGDTARSIKLSAGPDDVRALVAYAAGPRVAIDQSVTHAHVDELAHMPFPQQTWSSVNSSISPTGSCHIVTRGTDSEFLHSLWQAAHTTASLLVPSFAPWNERPDRDAAWRDCQAASLSPTELLYYALETPDDAFAADEIETYLSAPVWDACYDPVITEPPPGSRLPIVLGIDAAVSKDCFAIVGVSRHPERPGDPAIRFTKIWDPRLLGGRIDFNEVGRWLRLACKSGCPRGHPSTAREPRCELCAGGIVVPLPYRVVAAVYDPSQMEAMAQRLTRDHVANFQEFNQTTAREVADAFMHGLAYQGRLAHNGGPQLREHVLNAAAKISRDEELKMRIVKRSPSRRIDAAVAASMAVYEAMQLNIRPR